MDGGTGDSGFFEDSSSSDEEEFVNQEPKAKNWNNYFGSMFKIKKKESSNSNARASSFI